jgi:two-component system LytT family response regulator
MSLSCLVVDDEPLARKGLTNHLERVDFLTLAGQCRSANEARDFLAKEAVDLMFLDIKMPKISGLEFLRSLKQPPLVILTTAYPDYALEGFELDVVDYLLKPIDFDRFLKAVNKAYELRERQPGDAPESTAESDFIYVKDDQQYVKIQLADICFIEAWKDYVMVVTDNGRQIALVNIKHMAKQLPSDRFIRVHRSYLVAKNRIDAMHGNRLTVQGHEIPVGRSYRELVYQEIIARNLIYREGS